MLKQNITYADWDGNTCTDVLEFNISKTELADNLHLIDKLETIQRRFEGPQRELTRDEVQTLLDLVKLLIQLSYGERSDDGKRFVKSDEVYTNFTHTAAYDAFLFSLFETPTNAVKFILGIMPADLREQVQNSAEMKKAMEDLNGDIPEMSPTAPILEDSKVTEFGKEIVEPNSPLDISDEDLLAMDPRKMTPDQLLRAFQLKNK